MGCDRSAATNEPRGCIGEVQSCDERGMINAPGCFEFMDRASHYRHQADHARRLAEAAWQTDLQDMLRRVARDFDETAEDIEAGATEMRRPELLP
jgi:hypothetical protein